MVYPISRQAIDFVRKRATEVMQYQCRIERVTAGEHDEDSLVYTPGSRTVIYEGVCRVWEVSGGSPVVINESDIVMQSTNLSIPWDVPVVPQRNDEVLITSAPTDPALLNKRFQIQDSAKAGEMRPTRRFTVISMEKTS